MPDHHDAELVLRAYELRRESVMRDARNLINGQFWPKSYEDLVAVTKFDHPMNASYRQVATYWEMIYGMVKHGIVNADYFLESNGEGFLLFAKVFPYLEQYRKDISPYAFTNAEWATKECVYGRKVFAMFQARVAQMAATR
ncbi:MAG: hypothetical protein ABIT01_18875 [Thermoanaerobaculia bacterium]